MDQHKQNNGRQSPVYTGIGIVAGAAIGMIFGLMLFEQFVFGIIAGTAIGLIIGVVADAQFRNK